MPCGAVAVCEHYGVVYRRAHLNGGYYQIAYKRDRIARKEGYGKIYPYSALYRQRQYDGQGEVAERKQQYHKYKAERTQAHHHIIRGEIVRHIVARHAFARQVEFFIIFAQARVKSVQKRKGFFVLHARIQRERYARILRASQIIYAKAYLRQHGIKAHRRFQFSPLSKVQRVYLHARLLQRVEQLAAQKRGDV